MKKRKSKQIKSNFIAEEQSDFAIYRNGAFVGGLIGGVSGLILGKKVVLSLIIGALAGGYINYELNKKGETSLIIKR
jgi:uncharacterized protein YcfJ